MDERWKRRLGNGLLLVLSAVLLQRVWTGLPMFPNWDLLGYMGVAQEWVHDDPVEVHRTTYALAREELPPALFHSLVEPRQSVRGARYADPVAFDEHLAFYRARVLPTLMMKGLHASGMPLTQSLWWIHKASWVLTVVLMLLWLARWLPGWAAIVAATLFAHAPPLLSTAVMSTSDGLAALFLIAGVWLLVERRSPALAALASTLSILSRPDSIILLVLWIAGLAWLERRNAERTSRPFLGIWLAVSLAAYFGVQSHAGEYGWWPLFHISFLEKEIFPSQIPTAVEWQAYLGMLGEKASQIPGVGYFLQGNAVRGTSFPLVFGGFALLALAMIPRARRPERLAPHAAVLLAMLIAFTLRWFLFPQLWDRFFTPLYVLVPLLCVSMVATACEREDRPALDGAGDEETAQKASNESAAATTSS